MSELNDTSKLIMLSVLDLLSRPTEAMVDAGVEAIGYVERPAREEALECWRAMLRVARAEVRRAWS